MASVGDPISELRSAAVSVHELFLEYLSVGFTEAQALTLIGEMLRYRPA